MHRKRAKHGPAMRTCAPSPPPPPPPQCHVGQTPAPAWHTGPPSRCHGRWLSTSVHPQAAKCAESAAPVEPPPSSSCPSPRFPRRTQISARSPLPARHQPPHPAQTPAVAFPRFHARPRKPRSSPPPPSHPPTHTHTLTCHSPCHGGRYCFPFPFRYVNVCCLGGAIARCARFSSLPAAAAADAGADAWHRKQR